MQKAPPEAELFNACSPLDQWPKNSHSRMITGIGTPSSHNKIPRPIASSSNHIVERKRAGYGLVPYQWPVLGIDAHGSCGGFGSPF
jgi:hypothetical protein